VINTEAATLQELCVQVVERNGHREGTVWTHLKKTLRERDNLIWRAMSAEDKRELIGVWIFGLLYLAAKEGVDLYAEAQKRLYAEVANVAVNEVSPLKGQEEADATED
jgi:hypothetical protein